MERLVFLCLNNFFFIRCIVVTLRRNFLFRIEYLLLEEKHSTAVNPTRKTGFRIIAHRWSLTEIGLVPSQVNYPIFPYLLLTQSSKLKFFLSTGLFRYLNFMSFFNNKILYCLKNKYNRTGRSYFWQSNKVDLLGRSIENDLSLNFDWYH